jgi:Spy/CpxP family protein refolding chaperone
MGYMRSSFNTAAVIKRVAFAVMFASIACFSQPAQAEPSYLIAQGDASLPPPDPSYRPKNKWQGSNIDSGNSSGAATNSTSADDRPMRRRLRNRFNGGSGGGVGASDVGGSARGVGVGLGSGAGGADGVGANPGAEIGAGANAGGRLSGRAGFRGGGLGGGGLAGGRRFGEGALGAAGGARKPFQNGFGGGGGGMGGNLFGKRALDLTSLSLSPDQKQKIQSMREQLAPKTRELRKQLTAKRMELRDMMFEATAGDDQVRAKRREVRQLQDKVEDLQMNDFLAIRSVLTPDQRQKLTDLKPGTKFAAGNGGPAQVVAPVVSSP